MKNSYKFAISAFCLATLSACMQDESGSGAFTLDLTDAPVDSAQNVFVQFTGVELKGKDIHTFTFDSPKQIDLLNLQGSNSVALLENETLPAGKYNWVRLMVDTDQSLDTYIVMNDGTEHELSIPSGSETGLKLVRGFNISENGNSNFTIDFDVRKSIVDSNNGYHLKPALRIVDNLEIGHIKGNVDASLFASSCTEPAIYAFSGSVAPADISGISTDPVTTALVNFNEANGSYQYEIGFLETGTYTLALTCDSSMDDIETVDTLNFIQSNEVVVESKVKTTADFI